MVSAEWIKIVTDIYENRKTVQIMHMPEGDAIMNIWFRLLCEAGRINDGGLIYITSEISYTPESLCSQLRYWTLPTVRLALSTFEQFGMIENDNGFIKISSWEEYQNIEALEKIRANATARKRRERARKKEEKLLPDMSRDMSRDSHADVTQCHATEKRREEENREDKKRVDENRTDKNEIEEASLMTILTEEQKAYFIETYVIGEMLLDALSKNMGAKAADIRDLFSYVKAIANNEKWQKR